MHSDEKLRELEAVLGALSKVQAIIYFDHEGNILQANDNFCKTVGYREEEIVGRHHSIFVLSEYARSAEYAEFWRKLGRGERVVGKFTRVGKNGEKIFLEASYNAILNSNGSVDRVVKFAIDVTEREREQERLLTHVAEAATEVASEASDLIAKSSDLSKRSENQAATVEETSAAMEEISQTVTSNVKHAEEAAEEAQQANQHAEKGSKVVENAMAAMKKIEDGSKDTRRFIEVIDSIAFQTNLLALNAGVEAARAGEAGRGFAVVASEVRALAQRASESAKDMNALIDSSTRDVDEGARLVNETGAVLKDITEGVKKVATAVDSIFTASREQASGVREINESISTIDKDTQQNAAMAEESTESASALSRASAELMETISKFGVDSASGDNQRERGIAPPTPRPRPTEKLQSKESARPTPAPRPASAAAPKRSPAPLQLTGKQKIAVNQSAGFEEEDDDVWTEF